MKYLGGKKTKSDFPQDGCGVQLCYYSAFTKDYYNIKVVNIGSEDVCEVCGDLKVKLCDSSLYSEFILYSGVNGELQSSNINPN